MAPSAVPHLRRALWLLILALLACAAPASLQSTARPPTGPAPALTPLPGATPRGAATAVVSPFSGEAVTGAAERLAAQSPFAPYAPLTVNIAALDPALPRSDLQEMEKLPALQQLTVGQREALLEYGFVIVAQPFDSFAAAYAAGAEQKLPAFITVEAILHAFRVVTGVAWQRSEATFLTADLQALSHNMVLVAEEQWQAAGDDATAQAAMRNLGFFAVASKLLDPGFTPPPLVSQLVADELTLVAQGGRFISPLFGEELDYNLFHRPAQNAPNDSYARYLRARAWLARPFSLAYAPQGSDALQQLARARLSARQALLMAWGLAASDNYTRWQRLFEPTLYFEGAAPAWSLAQVRAASDLVFGPQPALAGLAADGAVDNFLATLHTAPPTLPFDAAAPPAFALLPMPAAGHEAKPDGAILRQLTYNRVGAYSGDGALPVTAVQTAIGAIRGLPRSLDVPAALGSPLARELAAAAGDAQYEGYELQLDLLAQRYAALDAAAWGLSFDGGWLFALQPLLAPTAVEGFLYAPAEAWQARRLSGWHAAWLDMRQPATLEPRPVSALAVSPDAAHGYLEPQPALYARLEALAAQVRQGLKSRGLLDDESQAKLQQLERLLDAARVISRKELAGSRLSADEALLLSQFVSRLQNLITYEPPPGAAAPLSGGRLSRLVDIYQEPTTGRLLQGAIGEAWPIYVLVPREQGVMLTMGAVLSNYELHGEQLSPTSWRELESRPAPPGWLLPYVIDAARSP